MKSASYYIDAIERALGLMRQGANSKAVTLLQDALDRKLDKDFSDEPEEKPLELAFNPRREVIEIPECWIDRQSHQLVIDNEGWEIDPFYLEFLVQLAQDSAFAGMSKEDREKAVLEQTEQRLRLGVKSGKVKRVEIQPES